MGGRKILVAFRSPTHAVPMLSFNNKKDSSQSERCKVTKGTLQGESLGYLTLQLPRSAEAPAKGEGKLEPLIQDGVRVHQRLKTNCSRKTCTFPPNLLFKFLQARKPIRILERLSPLAKLTNGVWT